MYTFILLYIIILCRVAHTLDCYVSIPFLIILSINYKYWKTWNRYSRRGGDAKTSASSRDNFPRNREKRHVSFFKTCPRRGPRFPLHFTSSWIGYRGWSATVLRKQIERKGRPEHQGKTSVLSVRRRVYACMYLVSSLLLSFARKASGDAEETGDTTNRAPLGGHH